jgi:hypothetical protein
METRKITINELRSIIRTVINEDKNQYNKVIEQTQKLVDEINNLIDKAIDSDGDPIHVVDKSGTWEEPMIYDKIRLSPSGILNISYVEPMSSNKKNSEKINKTDLELDGIPTLKNIRALYKKALKKNGIMV